MIYIDDMTLDFNCDLNKLCKEDHFGTKILALRKAYDGKKYAFLDFWVQRDDNNIPYSCICRYSDTIIICGEPYDIGEIQEFLQMLSPYKIDCSKSFVMLPEKLGMTKKSGEIMIFDGNDISGNCMYKVSQVSSSMSELKQIYDLLNDVFDLKSVDFEGCFLHMSHMIRHNAAEIYAIFNEKNEPVSTAAVVYKTEAAIIIGCVGTQKRYRKKGMAEAIIKAILRKHGTGKKNIYLQREARIALYDSLGFKKCGEWAEYTKL